MSEKGEETENQNIDERRGMNKLNRTSLRTEEEEEEKEMDFETNKTINHLRF